ncbi:MAG TPA: TIGR03560 family F420-dependent LLM class oxidoreductase [Actinomycetota bacterium]|jgi:F420-dependent oxidoreductase-like protein
MRLGLDVSQHQLDWPELLRRVRFGEEAGFDGAWVFDHFKALYGDRSGPCMEGWTLLAALAASTERIRLGALVTGMTYRHPSILAAEAVTVDRVSGGRLELAVGAAWFEGEHRELGIPFPSTRERTERLEEGVQVMQLLMTRDGASFEGKHYQLQGATYHPRPVQQPHPPIWIGAGGERRTIPIAARRADVWHSFGSVETLGRKTAVLERAAEAAGRDPASIARATDLSISEPWEEVRERAEALAKAGFSYLVVSWPSEGWGRLEEFVGKVMPELSA